MLYPLSYERLCRASDLRKRNQEARCQTTQRQSYLEGADRFRSFPGAEGLPTNVSHLGREHVERFIGDVPRTHSATTGAIRYCRPID